jgi:transmembrane sensor
MAQNDREAEARQSIQAQSDAWLNRLLSGDARSIDAEAFKAWRDADPAHAAAFANSVLMLRRVRAAAAGSQGGDEAVLATSKPRAPRRAVLTGVIAAASAGVLVLEDHFGPVKLWSSRPDFATRSGELQTIALTPGTEADLNVKSSLTRRAGGAELLSGEVIVTARGGSPFTLSVCVGRLVLREASADAKLQPQSGACVVCLSGLLTVDHPAGTVRLQPGRRLIYSRDALGAVTSVDPKLVEAWRRRPTGPMQPHALLPRKT